MSVAINEAAGLGYIEVTLTGKLAKEDYERFMPVIESAIARDGKIRLVVLLHDFHGWTAGALWDDLKFDWKHFNDIDRLALVGETRWEAGMAAFCRPFTKAAIKYFDHAQLDEARRWITADAPAAARA